MKEIEQDPDLELQLIVTCMHLSPEFGLTYKAIEADGFRISARVEMLLSSDTQVGVTKSTGLGMIGFADTFANLKPDVVMVLGDRFEALAAASAAMFARIPLAHISGGEITQGAIDDSIRHAITKMATYHFPGAETYRERIIRMGEDAAKVMCYGDPGLDNLRRLPLLSREALEGELGFELGSLCFLVTYHPVTLGSVQPESALVELLQALDRFPHARVIFTKPNADAGGHALAHLIEEFGAARANRVMVTASLGQVRYLSAMMHCDLVIGNSSSGIVEAPALKRPVVNIGDRQAGRLRATSIIDCPEDVEAIVLAIGKALSPEFQEIAAHTESLYGDSNASRRIVHYLKGADLSETKRYCDPPENLLRVSRRWVGGDFAVDSEMLQLKTVAATPGFSLPYTLMLDTGRSGIFVALKDILRRGGRKVAYLPAFCCDAVLFPFEQLGFDIRFYSAGKDLASPTGLPVDLEDTVFLFIHYFGFRNHTIAQWIEQTRTSARFFVIEDCVQASLTSHIGEQGDYAVTSLRKIAAQPDGAIVGSRTPLFNVKLENPDEAFVSEKLISKFLRGQGAQDNLYLQLLEDSEERLQRCAPRRLSWASSYLMQRTDFGLIANERRQNWSYLQARLKCENLAIIKPLFSEFLEDEVPRGYPIVVAEGLRDRLKMFLKERRIFCPVHWPLNEKQEASGWTEDIWLSRNILTIPIDQRMTTDALDYVVSSIRAFHEEG
jgi:UDP-N-acetylglucosamine 2-epimerase (non-hydrolysing)/GDP/UDP-N,N'-diacetylbacillosamine 2-epimerase (hydrolysing)